MHPAQKKGRGSTPVLFLSAEIFHFNRRVTLLDGFFNGGQQEGLLAGWDGIVPGTQAQEDPRLDVLGLESEVEAIGQVAFLNQFFAYVSSSMVSSSSSMPLIFKTRSKSLVFSPAVSSTSTAS